MKMAAKEWKELKMKSEAIYLQAGQCIGQWSDVVRIPIAI